MVDLPNLGIEPINIITGSVFFIRAYWSKKLPKHTCLLQTQLLENKAPRAEEAWPCGVPAEWQGAMVGPGKEREGLRLASALGGHQRGSADKAFSAGDKEHEECLATELHG